MHLFLHRFRVGLIASLLFLSGLQIQAQIFAGNDTTFCGGGSFFLQAQVTAPVMSTTDYQIDSITFSPVALPTTYSSLSLSDDIHSGTISIPFDFCFYGSSYNQLLIASNNYITFDLTSASAYSQWPINNAIPSTSNPANAIMGPWQDINPGVGGNIYYWTEGTAPYRKFIAFYDDVPMFSCTGSLYTSQIILYETTNVIETHITDKPLCATWNGGAAIHGLHDATQTQAIVVPNRNYPTTWTTSNEGMRFTPNATPAAYSVAWYNNATQISTSDTVTVFPSGVSTYIAELTYTCSGATFYDTMVISPSPSMVVTTSATAPTCFGGNNGTGTVTSITGGTGPYTYLWNSTPSQTTQTATGLAAGSYNVTVTDSVGCTQTEVVTVPSAPVFLVSASATPVSCNGGNNGTGIISITGGTSPFTYNWNTTPAQTTATATNLTAGSYMIIVTDNLGCLAIDTIIVLEPTLLVASASMVADVNCFGGTDGAASASAAGGAGNYVYTWNSTPTQVSQNATNLPAGTFIVAVMDGNGCVDTASVIISQPPQLTATVNTVMVSCNSLSDGTATVTPNGGVSPYTYSWVTTPVQTSQTATGLLEGTYSVTVTDNHGCTVSASGTVLEPDSLLIANIAATNSNCASTTGNGTATVVLTGGTTPYAYFWNSNPPQTSQTAQNLPAGTYSVIATDANGCTISGSVTIVMDQFPTADAGPDMSFCDGSGGVQLDGSASGGVSPYIYVWAPNNGSLSNPNVEDPIANPDSNTTYYFYVIGANGCQSNTDSMIVTTIDLPIVDVGSDVWRCENGPGNFITATVVNPVGGYSVQWSPSIGLYCDTCLTTYATPDTTTVYCATVTSLLTGCTSDPTNLNSNSCLVYSVRPRPVADAGPDFEVCQYDSMSTCGIATSAGPLYDFAWSPNFGVDDSTLVCPTFSPPFTTWYTLVVTSNGCPSYADSVQVTVRPTLSGDAGQVRTICANDSTQLDGQYNGAWAPTAFLWSPSAGLSDSTAQTPMASPATTTWYYFTVYNGLCPSIPDSVQVIVNPLPIANAGPDLQLCNEGDSITISGATATSGLPPYTYLWQPSSGLQDATLLNPNLKPDTTTLYTLTVFTGTAPNVCTDTDTMLIVVKPGLNLMVDVDTNTICQGQYAQLMSTAGSGSAVFTWSPSIGLANPNAANTLANPDTTVTYYLTATEHGCTSIDSIQVRVLDTPDAAFVASSTQSCGELSVAFLNLSADGSAYEWTFGDGSVSNQTSPVYTYTQSGTYTVTLVALSPGGCADTLIQTNLVSLSDPGLADFRSTPEPPVEVSLPNNSTISFYDQSELAVSWTWDFGDGVSSTDRNPNHTFVKSGVYYVTLTTKTADGCENTLRKGPYTVFTPELFVPNVFTPNNDGMNDGFLTNYGGDEAFLLQIFDRWGTKYFQTTNKNEAWQGNNLNGSKATDGVYFYTLRIGDRNYSGNVTLMR